MCVCCSYYVLYAAVCLALAVAMPHYAGAQLKKRTEHLLLGKMGAGCSREEDIIFNAILHLFAEKKVSNSNSTMKWGVEKKGVRERPEIQPYVMTS